MKQLLANLFRHILEETLVATGLMHSYDVYNVATGQYNTLVLPSPQELGTKLVAPWYTQLAGNECIVLKLSDAYVGI